MAFKAAQITHFFFAVFLAVIALIVMNYVGFYVHEVGSSSSAALHTMARQESSLTITYTYDFFAGVLRVPRSTMEGLSWLFAVLALLVIGLIYYLLVRLVTRWQRVRHNARAKAFVFIPFILLYAKDLVVSLGCKAFYCNTILTGKVQLAADVLMLIALAVLFVDLFYPRMVELASVEKKTKKGKA